MIHPIACTQEWMDGSLFAVSANSKRKLLGATDKIDNDDLW